MLGANTDSDILVIEFRLGCKNDIIYIINFYNALIGSD